MPLKILHLISSPYGLGGAEKLLLDMAELYDNKFSIYYCNLFSSPKKGDLFSKAVIDKNLPIFEVQGHQLENVPQIILRLKKLIEDENIDIVQTHLFHASLIGSLVGKLAGRHKTIITQHYTRNAVNKFFQKRFDYLSPKLADYVIAVSSAVKLDLMAQGIKESKIRVVHNGINLEEFDQKAENENHLLDDLKRQGKYIIGSVGNLHQRKDHSTLIKAMTKVVKKNADVHLVIVGEGGERQNLENLIEKEELKNNVTLAGFQSNVPALIKNFDLYVHPAKAEPFGIAVLEAMAASKGVIATKVEGVIDIVVNKFTGFLIPPQNSPVMAEFICRAIEAPAQMAEMGRKGRERVENKFKIENTVKGYQKLYREIT